MIAAGDAIGTASTRDDVDPHASMGTTRGTIVTATGAGKVQFRDAVGPATGGRGPPPTIEREAAGPGGHARSHVTMEQEARRG